MLRWVMAFLCGATVLGGMAIPAGALASTSEVEIVSVDRRDAPDAQQIAARLAWEVRKRTSVEPVLDPGRAKLTGSDLFRSPFLYWRGKNAFKELSEKEIEGLRRFVSRGGMVLIDDASAGGKSFDQSVRRALRRAFPARSLAPLPRDHTVYRSFYLVGRPVGRVSGPPELEAIEYDGRLAVLYTRHDLGGALEQDALGTWSYAVVPGGERQREQAIRLGVNILLYALCLDYKDDQVHAPFIMRRRGNTP